MYNILYADDEARYRKLVKVFLAGDDFSVTTVENGLEVLDYISGNSDVDLILLDIMMPEMDGREVCTEIRKMSDIPIIMLTALGDLENEVEGLNSGADDYISKPFSREGLIARINSLLRRTVKKDVFKYSEEGFDFLPDNGILLIDGKEVALAPKEALLFQYLLTNRDIVLARDLILNKVWGYDYFGDPRTVDTHIKSLRSKLGEYGGRVKTARGKGYYYQNK